jgi:hypothetical protein
MSSKVAIDIDPNPPSGLERLVAAVFLQVTGVPGDISSHLPAKTVSVSALLKCNIPDRLLGTSIFQPSRSCFSPLDLRWTIDELFQTPLPPCTWLNNLEENLSTMWGSGMNFNILPSSPKPSLQFPLWVASFWNAAVKVAEQRDE